MEIKFNNLNYTYNPNTSIQKDVLKDINISFKEGKITSLIGRSGSGKSTMAELMNALLFPSDGTIEIGNYLLTSKGIKNNKSFMNIPIITRANVVTIISHITTKYILNNLLVNFSFCLLSTFSNKQIITNIICITKLI